MYTDLQPEADKYLQEKILLVVYQYIIGVNSQRYFDLLRGILTSLFHFEQIDFHKYRFLYNFINWLECKDNFSEAENDMYEYFYQQYVADIKQGFDAGLL